MRFGTKVSFDETSLWLHDPDGRILFKMLKADVPKIESAADEGELVLPVQYVLGGRMQAMFRGEELAALRALLPSMQLASAT